MPIGGLGKRFSSQGYKAPKPLIQVDGMPMYRQAFSSFEEIKDHVSFFSVVRSELERNFGLATSLESQGVGVKIFEGNTRGAAETALIGFDMLDVNAPLAVVDCDVRFRSPELLENLLKHPPPFAGAVTYFESNDSRYSYAEINSNGLVVRTAEKQPISSSALIGCYAFSKASLFGEAASHQVDKGLTHQEAELYMSRVIDRLIENGDTVRAYPGQADNFGTPEELELFLSKN